MAHSSRDDSVASPRSDDRLESWKEIAGYLGRDVTTAQRWEKREGMPVHRHLHEKVGSVYAFGPELDAWQEGRRARTSPDGDPRDGAGNEPPRALERPEVVVAARPHRRAVFLLLFGLAVALAVSAIAWQRQLESSWRNPLADARFETITDFDGVAQAAAVSRDGRFAAFLADRDGRMDVWVTQLGSGQFHNVTAGKAPELLNPSIRSLAFSPDGSLVTFWARRHDASAEDAISVWAVPTMGGQPRPLLEGAAEVAWSPDATRIVYHTAAPGDPMFVADVGGPLPGRQVHIARAGLHAHYPTWSPDGRFIYFVEGTPGETGAVYRISPDGGPAERITPNDELLAHPVLLDDRTLVYLSSDPEGTGSRIFGMDTERRVPRQLSAGVEHYASLSAASDGRRVIATLANLRRTLWRVPLADDAVGGQGEDARATTTASLIPTVTGTGSSPRLGPGYLLYVTRRREGHGIWKRSAGASVEVWSRAGAQIIGAPTISPDGHWVAFAVREGDHARLHVIRDDGTGDRVVSAFLDVRGAPAWAPDGQSIVTSAVAHDAPQLLRVPLDGGPAVLLADDDALDPAWSPDGRLVAYSGRDVGASFPVRFLRVGAGPQPPALTLTRGARRVAFLPGSSVLLVMGGEIRHKDVWAIDLETGTKRRVTSFPADFDVSDFDVSPDGRELVVERVQERADVVLLDLRRP